VNCSADECSYKDLKIVRMWPSDPKWKPQAEILEAILNDSPEMRRDLQCRMDQAAKDLVADIERGQVGTGFFDLSGWEPPQG
jgi:hypothetical protein